MSKPYSIDPIAPDLLSLMTDSNGAVLPHAASTRDDARATDKAGCLEIGHQELPELNVVPEQVDVQELDGEGVVRQRQKERRQRRQQERQEPPRPANPVLLTRVVRSQSQLYLRVQQLAQRWDVSVPTVWRWTADGKIPFPLKLSPGTTRWRLDEIEAYEQKLEEGK
jgi:predicted DNA-binding transcriptional regulator AlpA